jgi:hypothetical protein
LPQKVQVVGPEVAAALVAVPARVLVVQALVRVLPVVALRQLQVLAGFRLPQRLLRQSRLLVASRLRRATPIRTLLPVRPARPARDSRHHRICKKALALAKAFLFMLSPCAHI